MQTAIFHLSKLKKKTKHAILLFFFKIKSLLIANIEPDSIPSNIGQNIWPLATVRGWLW